MGVYLRKVRVGDVVFDFFDVRYDNEFTIILKTGDEAAAVAAFTNPSEITILSESGQVIKTITDFGDIEYTKKIPKYYNDDNNVMQPAVEVKLKTLDINEKVKKIEKQLSTSVNEDAMTLDQFKEYRIQQSKDALSKYIAEHPLRSSAHNGVEATYTITEEKQNWMTQQYLTYQLEKQANPNAILTWNETGEVCEQWTEEEFARLLLEVRAFIYPLRAYQQNIEKDIMSCNDKVAVSAITFDYDSVANGADSTETTEESTNA